jgi:thioredoxin reductase (NADPH)
MAHHRAVCESPSRLSPVRPSVTVIGRRLEAGDHEVRDHLTRSAQPFTWLEADTPEAERMLRERGTPDAELPVVIDGDRVIAAATPRGLIEAWLDEQAPSQACYDVAIVGAGPAGLAAAVYASSDGLSTLVLESDLPGGQASHTSLIENFFGFPEGIGGAELARMAGRQAERFGTELLIGRGVTGHREQPDGTFTIDVAGGHEVNARAVVVAPGMEWRRLDVDGLDELRDRGVYYGAGRSETMQCAGDPVVVVGAGNSAGQAVMSLAQAGARVTMLVRGDSLHKSMSGYLVDRIAAHPSIEVRLETRLAAIEADGEQLASVETSSAGGEGRRVPARALFLCLGGTPRTAWAKASRVRLDEGGFILTGPDLLEEGRRPAGWPLPRDPLALETTVPGIFAAGDVRHGSTKRVAGAVGDGAMAIALVHRRLAELAAAA